MFHLKPIKILPRKVNISKDSIDIFKNPKHPYTIALLEAIPRITGSGLPKFDSTPPKYEKIEKYTHTSLEKYYEKFA